MAQLVTRRAWRHLPAVGTGDRRRSGEAAGADPHFFGGDSDDERFDLALIKAAPKLLAALHNMVQLAVPGMNWTDETGQQALNDAKAALAEAKGEKTNGN